MNNDNYDPPDDVYLFIVHLALQKYSLQTDEFYKLNDWASIYNYPVLVKFAYVALDLWSAEKFQGLHYKKQNDARLILNALLNAL